MEKQYKENERLV